jgi:hypothetical protein
MTDLRVIEDIKRLVRLPAFIGQYVSLRKVGGRYTGLCPFHKEKSPSLSVHDNYYKCFGCSAKGDVLTFYQEINSVNFSDAVKALAEYAGVSLDPRRPMPRAAQHAAREDAAVSAWWWARRRQCVIDATCVAFNDEDEEFAECCGRLRRWIEAMSPADRVNQWLCHGTAAERREYRQEMADKEAWVAEMRGMWVAALAEDSAA